ncbi:MAG TPA: TIGR03619 family F420-dependent LLM class oxidoreductase [Steroidobacteraceae bacterium]|nr:TIGR03619 family F420-dependent LLM class oxidoreductase [Steroidobacteraceae bacterium]
MQYGVSFPHVPFGAVSQTRDLAQTYDNAAFDYMTLGGHLLTARPGRYKGRPDRLYATPFHDPFVVFAYLAAVTSRIRLITSIAILPMLETAVVARQAIDLAFLSNDRYELGVGLSWQEAEYRALGHDLRQRGARMTEQVQLLKLFWSQRFVTYKGKFHDIDDVGFDRIPRKPIPLWFGSQFGEAALRRVASYGDGWMPLTDPTDVMARFRGYLSDAGRDPASCKIMGNLTAGEGGPDAWIVEAKRLQSIGITHLTIGPDPALMGDAGVERAIEAREAISKALQ